MKKFKKLLILFLVASLISTNFAFASNPNFFRLDDKAVLKFVTEEPKNEYDSYAKKTLINQLEIAIENGYLKDSIYNVTPGITPFYLENTKGNNVCETIYYLVYKGDDIFAFLAVYQLKDGSFSSTFKKVNENQFEGVLVPSAAPYILIIAEDSLIIVNSKKSLAKLDFVNDDEKINKEIVISSSFEENLLKKNVVCLSDDLLVFSRTSQKIFTTTNRRIYVPIIS